MGIQIILSFLLLFLFFPYVHALTQVEFNQSGTGYGCWIKTNISDFESCYDSQEAGQAYMNNTLFQPLQQMDIVDSTRLNRSFPASVRSRFQVLYGDAEITLYKDKGFILTKYEAILYNKQTGEKRVYSFHKLRDDYKIRVRFYLSEIENVSSDPYQNWRKYMVIVQLMYGEDVVEEKKDDPFPLIKNATVSNIAATIDKLYYLFTGSASIYGGVGVWIQEGEVTYAYQHPASWTERMYFALIRLGDVFRTSLQESADYIVQGMKEAMDVILPDNVKDWFTDVKNFFGEVLESGFIIIRFLSSNLISLGVVFLMLMLIRVLTGEMSVDEFIDKLISFFMAIVNLLIRIASFIRNLIPFV